MYLLYEHHKDPATGEILATDMLLSSWYPGRTGINFQSAEDKALFELCKMMFKAIPIKSRSIDMSNGPDGKPMYVWSFFGTAGKLVYDVIKASPLAAAGIKFQAVQDLAGQRAVGRIEKPAAMRMDPADFFYQPEAPASSGPSKEKIMEELVKSLLISKIDLEQKSPAELKKYYRSAALRLHPDRNNGDAKGMTELNYYWQQWQPYAAS